MSVADRLQHRQISEVVHFTTNAGCLGTLCTNQVQSRKRLHNDPMVKYLFSPNASLRKDIAHLDYVNLSISHINTEFFRTSSNSWHRNEPIFWCILSFDPAILTHNNVIFASTNNIYSGVKRGSGLEGFETLFSPSVTRWHGNVVQRAANIQLNYPTCAQAEVLYPQALSTDYLRCIYVANNADQSEVMGFIKASFHPNVAVVVSPDKFGFRPV